VGPEKPHDLATVDRQRDIFHHRALPIDLAQTRGLQAAGGVARCPAGAAAAGAPGEGILATQNETSAALALLFATGLDGSVGAGTRRGQGTDPPARSGGIGAAEGLIGFRFLAVDDTFALNVVKGLAADEAGNDGL